MMRVLHVVPTYLPATRYGGPIYSVHGLCKALTALGHAVEVCTTSVDGPHDSQVVHEEPVDVDGVRVRYFRSKRLRRLYYAPGMQEYLRRSIGAHDIVHLHSVFLWPTSMAARLAETHGVPYVVAPRGMLVPELIRKKSRWIKTAWLRTVERRTLRCARGIHVTTDLERRDALRVGLPLPRPFVIPNGVDTPPATIGRLPDGPLAAFAGRGPYGLYLGRLHWKKGLDRLLEAMTFGTTRMVLCGPDDENYRATLDALRGRLRLPDDRLFIGDSIHGEAKWALLGGARFLVLPSLHENFGNVVAEAMAAGRPVVVTPEVGAHEIALEAGAGIVAQREPSVLGAAMQKLWDDDAERDAMGERGRRYALANLTWERVATHLTERYADLIGAAP